MKNERKYNFLVEIYEDDENFDSQMFNLQLEYQIMYIRHDKDVYEKDILSESGEVVHSAGD